MSDISHDYDDIPGTYVFDFDKSHKGYHLNMFCGAVRTLPNNCRRAFILKKVYGFSQKEIAQYMQVTESTVEKNIAKGMLMCRDYMRCPFLSMALMLRWLRMISA